MNKHNSMLMTITTAMISVVIVGSAAYVPLANSQLKIDTKEKPLPVLLIHGYNSDASAWKKWEGLLKNDGIPFYPITFEQSDDKCGSVIDHAKELNNRVRQIQNMTGSKQVNIVGHSKGGLDARVYLAYGTNAVANLIMIGTPNDGSPIAEISDPCKPAVYDLRPGANATKAEMNPNTKYYTIAGDWDPSIQGNPAIPGNDDGLVAVASVESQGYFKNLGHTSDRHEKLLEEDEYKLAQDILIGQK
jgi:pimeloyl-ACP methyl ester carboxylesterase